MPRDWKVLLVGATFLSCIVFAGHAMVPLVFLLIAGSLSLTPAVFGAVAVVMLLTGFFLEGRAHRILTLAGALLSILVWIGIVVWSDSPGATVVFSIHFLAAVTYFLFSVIRSSG